MKESGNYMPDHTHSHANNTAICVVEDLHGNTSGCGLRTSSLMQSKVSSVPEDEEGDEAPPITMATQDPAHTPFTSVMIGSMTTSLWASASNVPLEPGTIDPLRVHQVIVLILIPLYYAHSHSIVFSFIVCSFSFHCMLILIPLYAHSHSTISSVSSIIILVPIPLYPLSGP